ncbi:DUF5680 domain-containing protein [Ewingella americana]|jgi:hypothetical protein|uniref:DUF5680 domain-containing protein n=1 Tax=Ewingella americana TaxID=41202 RepID=A0A502GEN7_9GAMM|nr:DUF5680 domain-containing protein [Ewingella americana]TPG60777.1 hypothetical protein EAH77_14300 [Ewingella americana]
MIPFLVEANHFLYSHPDNVIIKNSPNGDMQLIEYCRGEYIYRNYYIGYRKVNGIILVLKNKKPIWIMTYEGGVSNIDTSDGHVNSINKFVRQNLARSTIIQAIRGPSEFHTDKMSYRNRFFGSINKFNGIETVTGEGKVIIYTLMYSGSNVII